MSLETDVCRAYLDVMEIVGNRIESDLVAAARQGSVTLDEHELALVTNVVKTALAGATDTGINGISSVFRNAPQPKKPKRKK
jgi:hypothetical protein